MSDLAGAIINLRRTAAGESVLEPIPPEESLRLLLEESRSPDGRCSAAIMHALAHLVGGAASFNLHYAEAADAARLLSEHDNG